MATQVNIHEAKTELSRLIAAVEHGEEVVIARAGKPVARLVPVDAKPVRRPRSELRGMLKGRLWMAEDAFSPEVDAEIAALFNADNPDFEGL